jgi:hypothetical protein
MSKRPFQLLALLAGMACASASTQAGSSAGHNSNRITSDEVIATNGQTAYEVINKARPQYLKTRGQTTVMLNTPDRASVFMDGVLFGDPESLKSINATQIREIRYYPSNEAVIKFGSSYGNGVIDIRTK